MTKQSQSLPDVEKQNTPLLKIPSRVRLPNVPIDHQRVNQALNFYRWDSATNPHQWAHQNDLIVVGTYLIWWETDPYWEIILQGGVRGYSLYLHELMELDWYFKGDANPFNFYEQTAGYSVAHAEGLLYEHRFLQVVARTMGYSFSLRELIIYNPHGDLPQDDWETVLAQKPHDLSHADKTTRPDSEREVREFYNRLGFKEV